MNRKIAAVVFCVIMMLNFCFPAFAEEVVEPSSQPKVMLTDYGVDGTVSPGSVFKLRITVKNSSQKTEARNIKVSVAESSGSILPWKMDYVLVNSLAAGKSYDCFITMKVTEDFDGGYCNIQAAIDYEDVAGQNYQAAGTMIVSVEKKAKTQEDQTQPVLMVTDYSIKGSVVQGNTISVIFTVTNKSRTKSAHNIKLGAADASGTLIPKGVGTAFISEITAGSSRTWSVPFKVNADSEGGVSSIAVTMEYETKDGEKLSSSDSISITVPKKKAETVGSQPRLMVSGFSMSDGYISPDEERALTVRIENTSKTESVSNVKLSLADASGEICPEGTGTKYVELIKAGETFTWTVKVSASHTAASGEHPVAVGMEYEDSSKNSYSSSDTIRLDVRQSAVLTFSRAQLPVKVTQSETVSLTVSLMNTGKSTLTNCQLDADIPKMEDGGTILVGEIKPGETKTGTINFRVDSEYTGKTDGTLTIRYEDDFGQTYEERTDLSTIIQEKIEIDNIEEKEEKKYPLWWLFAIVGVIIGGGVGAGIPIAIYSTKQRRKDEESL